MESLYQSLDDNWKWYEQNYPFEFRNKDLLDGEVKPEDQARYDQFKQQVIQYRGSDDILEHDRRTPQWFQANYRIIRLLKEALRRGKSVSWVKQRAGVSESTYNRHLYLSEEVNALHTKLKKQDQSFGKKSVTVCIDMKTYKRYEFDSRKACDHYFGWPRGVSSTMIHKKKYYRQRYWIFDKKDEEKMHGGI